LIELDFNTKQCFKHQIVPPGEHFDPLKLGEGPFPIPIGQSSKEVLARFTASTIAKSSDPTLASALGEAAVEGLLLVPRPGPKEAGQSDKTELFYDPTLLLPVGILLTEANGSRKTVALRHLKRNEGLDEKQFMFAEPDPKEWHIEVEKWRDENAAPN